MALIKQIDHSPGCVKWVNEYGHSVGIMIASRSYYLEATEAPNNLRLWNPEDLKEFSFNPTRHHLLRFHGSAICDLAYLTPKPGLPSLSDDGYDITDVTELNIREDWYQLFCVDTDECVTLPNGKVIKHSRRENMVDYYKNESFKSTQETAE